MYPEQPKLTGAQGGIWCWELVTVCTVKNRFIFAFFQALFDDVVAGKKELEGQG